MTHYSFISMWFTGSLALAVLTQCAYFFWLPYWKYFLIFNISLGLLVTLIGSLVLVGSPMQFLIKGDTCKAAKSIEWIKRFNGLKESRKIKLDELSQKVRL